MLLGENLKFVNKGIGGHIGTTITIYDQAANLASNGAPRVENLLPLAPFIRGLCHMQRPLDQQ